MATTETKSQQSRKKPGKRPARSNSLQRMLELEKQCMLERRNAHIYHDPAKGPAKPAAASASGTPDTASPTTPSHTFSFQSSSSASPSPRDVTPKHRPTMPRRQLQTGSQASVPSLAPRDPNRQSTRPSASRNHLLGKEPAETSLPPQDHQDHHHHYDRTQTQSPYQLPPIDTGASAISLAAAAELPVSPVNHVPSARAGDDRRLGTSGNKSNGTPGTARATADHKTVAFALQPDASLEDRRSVCQSPSWEAYGRRKKEKKEKELADKEAKARKRRLSKAPPSPSSATTPTSAPPKSSDKAGHYPPQSWKGLAPSQTEACMSDSSLPRRSRQTKERPNSSLGLSSPDLPLPGDLPTPTTPATPRGRSRSSSLSSLFRAPFEFRRSSIDQAPDSGFIGGIKLEQHRLAAQQQALNDLTIGPDADIHPALRKTEKRSASPLRFLTPRHEPRDAAKKAYPPNTYRTSGSSTLLVPEPQTHESGKMERLRARVGLKSSAHKSADVKGGGGQKLTKTPSAQREESRSRVTHSRNMSSPVISSPIVVQQVNPPVGKKAKSYKDRDIRPLNVTKANQLNHKPPFDSKDTPAANLDLSSPKSDNSQPSFTTADESPPTPPRRSSKRKSMASLSDINISSPPIPSPLANESHMGDTSTAKTQPAEPSLTPSSSSPVIVQRRPVPESATDPATQSKRWTLSDPPSIPYDSLTPHLANGAQPKRTLKEAAKAAFGRGGPMPPPNAATPGKPSSRSSSPYSRRPYSKDGEARYASAANAHPAHAPKSKLANVSSPNDFKTNRPTPDTPANHSSEDSCSDDFRFPSGPGTPDTSRPQSERGVFPMTMDHDDGGKLKADQLSIHHSGYTSVLPSPAFSFADNEQQSNQPPAMELDPIQAAALKVMAAFPDAPLRRPDPDRRANSDTNLVAGHGLLSKGKNIPFQQQRDRSKPRPIRTSIEPARDPESKSPPLRELIMSKDESSVAAPWPATYLEAARKAAPAAPAPKTLKQQASSSPSIKPSHQPSPSLTGSIPMGDPIAKMFVECCSCKYYHDMPSKLYEAMVHPEGILKLGEHRDFAGSVSMTVKCPWCKHEMSTKCCAGLAAMVYVKERLH